VLDCACFHSIFIFALVCLLPVHIVLLELVLAAAPFEAFQEVLAIDVLDNRPLHHAGQALENATGRSALVFIVNVDDGLGLGQVVTLDACSLLSAGPLTGDIACGFRAASR